jgi:hypothetical protein
MGSIPCPNCGRSIASQAQVCPHCQTSLDTGILDVIPVEQPRARAPRKDTVRVRFHCGGVWMLFDAPVYVALDGDRIGEGTVKKGFDILVRTTPGEHDVEVFHGAVMGTPRHFLQFEDGGYYEVELAYSRTWGNYSTKPKVVLVDKE